jgi:hypothetical protein
MKSNVMGLVGSVAAFTGGTQFGAFDMDPVWITRLLNASVGRYESFQQTEERVLAGDAFIAEHGLKAWREKVEKEHRDRKVKIRAHTPKLSSFETPRYARGGPRP